MEGTSTLHWSLLCALCACMALGVGFIARSRAAVRTEALTAVATSLPPQSCAYPARGVWELDDSRESLGSWRVRAWRGERRDGLPPCTEVFSPARLSQCFAGAEVHFWGDSTSIFGWRSVAIFAHNCTLGGGAGDGLGTPPAPSIAQPASAAACAAVEAALQAPGQAVDVGSTRLQLQPGPAAPQPYRPFLRLMDVPALGALYARAHARGVRAAVILNLGTWDMHFGVGGVGGAFDEEELGAHMRALIERVAALPCFRTPRARASGALVWCSLNPTEVPRREGAGLGSAAAQRKVDERMSALWEAAGFPVADASAVMIDGRGDAARTVTTDSVHLVRHAEDVLYAYVLSQACDLLAQWAPTQQAQAEVLFEEVEEGE